MHERFVFPASDVVPFSPAGDDSFTSRLLIEQESIGSEHVVMNLFTLKPGKATEPGSHPAPHDEIYYVLSGSGMVRLGSEAERYSIEPNTVVFIPNGTLHSVQNTGDADLQLLTVMPGTMEEGANSLYDARKKEWGQTFRRLQGERRSSGAVGGGDGRGD